jgi:Cell Wall Hydrolase
MASDDLAAPPPLSITPIDRDMAIRTMVGEGSNQNDIGQAAIAHVMLNRLQSGKYGGSLGKLATDPSQFEAWTRAGQARQDIGSLTADDPAYQQAARVFDAVASGTVPDPTGGALNFLNPKLQVQMGRSIPAWAQGQGLRIGDHVFYGGGAPQSGQDAITAIAGPPAAARTAIPASVSAYSSGTGGRPAPASSPSGMSDDDVDALILGKPAATPSPKAAGAAGELSDADVDALILGKPAQTPAATVKAPTPAGAPAAPLANAPGDTLLTGAAKNVATGAIKGMGDIPGAGGNLTNLGDYLLARIESAVTGKPVEQVQAEHAATLAAVHADMAKRPLGALANAIDPAQVLPSGSDVSGPILARTGEYVPTSPLGRAVQGGVETAVGSLAPGVKGAGPVSAGQLAGAGAAGTAGTAVADATGEPLYGLAGAVAAPLAAKAGLAGANRLAGSISPETAALAATARNQFGIPINAGQMSETPAVRFMNSVTSRLPFSGATADNALQQSAFNRAVSNTFGESADKITPAVMQGAKRRIGAVFDNVAKNTDITLDAQLGNDLMTPIREATSVLPEVEVKPLMKQVTNILDTLGPGNVISGDSYQALTRKGAPLDRVMNSQDPNVRHYAGQIKDALDSALQRYALPGMADDLREARLQYKNMKTVEDLASKSTTGDISPSLLMQAVRKSYGNMAYNGGGDIGDLARIGQRFLKEPPSSGTAERLGSMGALGALGRVGLYGAAGIGASDAIGSIPGISAETAVPSLAAIPAGILAGRMVGSGLRSDWLANNLISRALGRQPVPTNNLASGVVPFMLQQRRAPVPLSQ